MKQTIHQVSCQSLFNHGNFSAGSYIKQGSSRGSLQCFSSSSLNRSIILPFSELMDQEPRHHLVLNCLHSTIAVEQLSLHFLRVSRRNVAVEKSSITVLFLSLIKPLSMTGWDKVGDIVSHFFPFVLKFGSWFNKPLALILKNGWLENGLNK